MLEAGKRDEKSSLSVLRLENAVTVLAEAVLMASLGQRLCWRRCRVELEGKKHPAVTENAIFNELTGETGKQ